MRRKMGVETVRRENNEEPGIKPLDKEEIDKPVNGGSKETEDEENKQEEGEDKAKEENGIKEDGKEEKMDEGRDERAYIEEKRDERALNIEEKTEERAYLEETKVENERAYNEETKKERSYNEEASVERVNEEEEGKQERINEEEEGKEERINEEEEAREEKETEGKSIVHVEPNIPKRREEQKENDSPEEETDENLAEEISADPERSFAEEERSRDPGARDDHLDQSLHLDKEKSSITTLLNGDGPPGSTEVESFHPSRGENSPTMEDPKPTLEEPQPQTSLDLSQRGVDGYQPCLDLSQANGLSHRLDPDGHPHRLDSDGHLSKLDSDGHPHRLDSNEHTIDLSYPSSERQPDLDYTQQNDRKYAKLKYDYNPGDVQNHPVVDRHMPASPSLPHRSEHNLYNYEERNPRDDSEHKDTARERGMSPNSESHSAREGREPSLPHISHIPYSCDPSQEEGDLEPPQHSIRFPIPRPGEYDSHPQNLHQSPPVPHLHHSPQSLHLSPAHTGSNVSQSPAHPLNLHQSPAHPIPSPNSENSFQRTPYHPPPDQSVDSHLQGLQYSMGSQYSPYNHHYFNNANSYGQNFMSSHGFPHNFSSEVRSMMGSHEMYMNQSRMQDPHAPPSFKPEFGHPGILGGLGGNHPSPRQDPYSFSNSDDDVCSPNRTPAPYSMGFSSMPMPLITPKAKKPRKPRKPRSPKPDALLPMQLKEEDSRSSDLDQSFDDDCDGKLVIAEHDDDLELKDDDLDGLGKEKKPRRKHNRFNGLAEEEVMKRLLPDLICPNLDILIVGINPGLYAAFKQHHYAGPGNHFWKCMFLSGLIPRPMNAENDHELLGLGIGFTNIVERTTRASQELNRQEIEEGADKLIAKIKEFNPRIAVFNGKGIYEVFSGQKEFIFGKQPDKIKGTDSYAWVMPNSSARCAQLPRAVDKVPFYTALKKFRDYLRGEVPDLDESEVVFPEVKLQNFNNKRIKDEDELERDGEESRDGMDSRIDPDTGKKRRGRPPKPRPDGTLPPPKRKRIDEFGNPLPKGVNPIDPITGKKKRGRPKKNDLPPPPHHMHNGMVKPEYLHRDDGTDSDAPSSISKTPTRLPPFSPNFARMGPMGKDDDSECGERPTSVRLRTSMDDDGSKDLRRPDSLPDLSGRLGHGPHSPLGKELHHPDFDQSMPEEETSHSDDRRPDSARSLSRPQTQCNFSNPTTPVDAHGFPGQQSFPGFPLKNDPHHSPNYPQQPSQQQSFHAPYRTNHPLQETPPHQSFDSPQPPVRQVKQHDPSDVSSKSLTGLESLVDQIPAIAENDSGVFSGSGGGSHPPTPRSVGPYSPNQYHSQGSYLNTGYPGGQYSSGQQAPPGPGNTPGSDSYPTDLSTSTNYNVVSTTSSHSPVTHSNFSVSSLAHSSVGRGGETSSDATITGHGASSSSDAFSVSNLASSYASSLTSEQSDISKYPPGITSNPYMSGMSNSSSMFSPGALMSRGISPAPNFMSGSMGSSVAAGMAGMGMAGMAGMYGMSNYGQYSPAGAYTGAAQAFAAAATGSTYPPHGLHMPNPSYPYPSPYTQSPYSQSPYF